MKIRGQLKSIWPDRTQYKPYAYNLEMQNVFVEVDVDDEMVTYEDTPLEGGAIHRDTILNLNGFTCLLGTFADALDEMHLASLKNKNHKQMYS